MLRTPLALVILVVAIGATLIRLFPIFAGQPWLSEFFMTEDGYLMLTVARNMAIGLGMSVSEGTIATNGVQPMATFLFAIPYWLTGGDKTLSLIGITLISVIWSIAGLFVMRAYARLTLSPRLADPIWAWLAAALWFSGPLILRHTMNALETGLYTVFVLLALLWFARILRLGATIGTTETLGFGALCGLVFLARNDGAFLVTAIFFSWMLYELFSLRRGVLAVAARLVPSGLLCLAVASPWMIYNKLQFGSIMPISGSAQIMGAEFGQNLALVPVKLFEFAFPMLPIPSAIEANPAVIAICLAAVALVCVIYLAGLWRSERHIAFLLLAYGLYALMLCGYYGLYFGAPHFVSRYLSPIAPLLIVASLSALATIAQQITPRHALVTVAVVGIGGLLLSSALLLRQMMPGVHNHGHFQVVRWVDENLSDETWVGAIQTGTLGYWHDRTINLDGKVNPEALAATMNEGHVLNYVVSSKIDYIVDWFGMASWAEHTETSFPEHFELIVADPDLDLSVTRRKHIE